VLPELSGWTFPVSPSPCFSLCWPGPLALDQTCDCSVLWTSPVSLTLPLLSDLSPHPPSTCQTCHCAMPPFRPPLNLNTELACALLPSPLVATCAGAADDCGQVLASGQLGEASSAGLGSATGTPVQQIRHCSGQTCECSLHCWWCRLSQCHRVVIVADKPVSAHSTAGGADSVSVTELSL